MYADFDRIACKHEHSWRYGHKPRDAESIGTVTKRNRMICSPCEHSLDAAAYQHELLMMNTDPLLMNAFNTVNLAAACVLTSVQHAECLGIPRDKWIYVLGGAGTSEQDHCKTLNPMAMEAREES